MRPSVSKPVEGAVLPLRARLKVQRQFAHALDAFVERAAGRQVRPPHVLAGWTLERIRETRCVRQQIANGDLARRRHQVQPCSGGIARQIPDRDLRVLVLGHELRDRIAQHELPFFDQHQDRYRGHRLGHRREPEQRVVGHRLVRLDVRQTVRLEVHDFPFSRDQRHRAGKVFGVDVALDHGMNALQTLRRHPDIFGLRHERRSAEAGGA